MKTSKKYTKELYKQFRYLATWLPGTPLKLGDIGLLHGKEFTRIGNLGDDSYNIKFEIEQDQNPASIHHSSEGAVTVTAKGAGTVSPQNSSLLDIEAGFNVSFKKENAILFKAIGTLNHTIKDQIKLGNKVLGLYKDKKWDKDYVVITELVEAESATILISREKNSIIDLKVNGDVGASGLNIADANLGLGVSFSRGLNTEIIAEKGLTPLFKISKVKNSIFSPPAFEFLKLQNLKILQDVNYAPLDNELNYFGEVSFDDMDDFETK